MTPEEIQRKLAEFRELGKATTRQISPKAQASLVDQQLLGTSYRCPHCRERLASIPHWKLVDEHFGCGGCGRVFYECDGKLRPCRFIEQDVPGWRLKHEPPGEVQTGRAAATKTSKHDFCTPTGDGVAR